ncbi:hypothetical protein F2P81_009075 [Scophthalmus maximus]|uniref:Uncharacterized protein n=1 Tax=Scophthalmus maximus TaxID=52904 RepID=A0A6A4T647_SCOMX|nr:hypothetical protein F2P81_009075 [Scophthalmus maximus]
MESKGEVVNNLVRTLLQHCTLAHSAPPAPFLRVPEATEGCKAAGKQYWSTLLVQPDKTCRKPKAVVPVDFWQHTGSGGIKRSDMEQEVKSCS